MNTIFPLSAGLRAFSTVTVQIAAQTSAGIGPYSDIVAAITKEGRKSVIFTVAMFYCV